MNQRSGEIVDLVLAYFAATDLGPGDFVSLRSVLQDMAAVSDVRFTGQLMAALEWGVDEARYLVVHWTDKETSEIALTHAGHARARTLA